MRDLAILVILACVLLLLIAAGPVTAQVSPVCAARAEMLDVLARRFDETVLAMGLSGSGLTEVWANRETGTFTVTFVAPDGTTCIVASGEGWEDRLPARRAGGAL